MSYHEISSAQIVLSEPDTIRHFVREVRGGRARDALALLLDWLPFWRRKKRWPPRSIATGPDVRLVALCVVGVCLVVALCFVLAAGSPPAPAGITALPLAPPTTLPSSTITISRQRVLDTEPHGARVFRAGHLVGTTPLLYEMPETDPLGSVDLRLDGYRVEHRFVDETSPRILVIPLRRR